MLSEQVDEIHELRQRLAELGDEIQRKIDGLVIAVLAHDPARSFSERDVSHALTDAGFEMPIKDVYPLLTRLAKDTRIERVGLTYRAIQPSVLKRQLTETPTPNKADER